MSNLKPCPFCGGESELISNDTTTYGYPTPNWAVRCVNETCIANDITPNYSQHEDAVDDWNRRPEPANVPLAQERFEQICEAVHNGWWEEKKRQGVTDHPDMIPYCDLSEPVKEYDRVTVQRVLDALGITYQPANE